jgi:hypothetical protein
MPDATDDAWYTENILRLPTGLLWRSSLRQGLFLGPQVFLILLVRKALGWKLRPAFALRRATELPRVSERSVPADVLERFVPVRRACQAGGLHPCFLTKPPYLGGRTVYAAAFLSEDGLISAVAALIVTTAGRTVVENLVFLCESQTTGGKKLVTQPIDAVTDAAYVREGLALPEIDLLPLSLSADASQAIAAHRERIAGRADLIRFDAESLGTMIVTSSQRYFDWRVERGLLVPVPPRDLARLSAHG